MTNQPSSRDLDLLSAYLDGQLSQSDGARLELRLKADPELRSVYESLRQTRALLRQLPVRRAPRNFRLTPQMAGIKPALPRSFPIFRLASVLASVLLFIGYAINLSASAASMAAATTMAYDTYQAPVAEATNAPGEAATAAPEAVTATEAPAPKFAPSATEAPPITQQSDLAPTATDEASGMGAASTEMMPQANINIAPEDSARSMPQPSPMLPIHPGWLFGLLGLAVVSGASAFFTRLRVEQQKPTAKDVVLMVIALVVVVIIAAGIYWMSLPR